MTGTDRRQWWFIIRRDGHARAAGHLEDRLAELADSFDVGAAAGDDDAAQEVLGEPARVEVLAYLREQFVRAVVDNFLELGARNDCGRTVDVRLEFDFVFSGFWIA